jgi:hypothetical protein
LGCQITMSDARGKTSEARQRSDLDNGLMSEHLVLFDPAIEVF